jgi:hypothetical protein
MPRELGRVKAIPLPAPASKHSPDAEKDDPTPELEELAPALSARVEAATVAVPAAGPTEEIQDADAASVEGVVAPPVQGAIPVLTTEAQTVSRAAIQAERTDQQQDAQLQATAAPADNEAVEIATEEICEIAVWRGYAKSRFYGRLDASDLPETTDLAVAESHPFRFRGNGEPDRTEAAEAAYEALVEKLVADGWELDSSGDAWYASRFRRPLTYV